MYLTLLPTCLILWQDNMIMYKLIFTPLIVLFSYWVLFKFFQEFNWARILVLNISVFAILNLSFLETFYSICDVILILEATLGTYLLTC